MRDAERVATKEADGKSSVSTPSLISFVADQSSEISVVSADDRAREDVRQFAKRQNSLMRGESTKVLGSNLNLRLSRSQVVQDMTLNKLRFSDLHLVGREAQVADLDACLERLQGSTEQVELVMIRGMSGSGKSALARILADRMKASSKGVFVKGKFSRAISDQPYSTILLACHDLVSKIGELAQHDIGKRTFHDIKETLVGQFATSELQLLIHAVPVLGKLLKQIDEQADKSDKDLTLLQNDNKDLLECAFRKFFRVISSYLTPLVLCLDDLQWTDPGTLAMIEGLVRDKIPNLLVVGCYRSNEVDNSHLLSLLMNELKSSKDDLDLNITELECGNLTVSHVNQIVMTLTAIEESEKTLPLAELCHRRTLGNAFYLLIFVEMLNKDGLLNFNLGNFSWEWNLDSIQQQTGATSNVVELMAKKMSQSSPELVQLLKYASCVGNEFSAPVLYLIWSHLEGDMGDDEASSQTLKFEELLQESIREKFLERCHDGLRWVHDKVQETVVSLDSEDVLAERKEKVGRTLLSGLGEQDLEEALFVVVDLLNSGKLTTSVELARLNLRAARKAKSFSAFGLGGTYAERGIQNLDSKHCWAPHTKDLAVELYSIRSEAASVQGEFETMNKYCEVVLNQEQCTMLDKISCYDVQIHHLARTRQLKEAMNKGIKVIGKLGCKIPLGGVAQTGAAVSALIGFKTKLKKQTPSKEDLAQLPRMSDPTQKQVMRLLSEVGVHAYLSNTPMVWILSNIKMVSITIKYGLADQAQTAFALTAIMIMHALGDWKMGAQYAELSMLMHRHLDEHIRESAAICISRGMILSYIEPLQAQLKFLMEGYRKGMEVGDVEWAFGNIAFNVEMCSVAGRPLESVVENIEIYLPQFEALNASYEYASMTRIFWQASLNLMGLSDNTIVLTGTAMNEADFLQGAATTARDKYRVMKSFLCVYFGYHEEGAKMALERGNGCYQDNPGQPCITVDPFLRSLSLFASARESSGWKRRKYKRAAETAMTMVRKWVKKGNPNVVHQLELLRAEDAALRGRSDVSDLYNTAARTALRSGWIHDAALSSERHAEYLKEKMNLSDAALQMKEAIDRYSVWGARRLVERLRSRHADLLSHISGE